MPPLVNHRAQALTSRSPPLSLCCETGDPPPSGQVIDNSLSLIGASLVPGAYAQPGRKDRKMSGTGEIRIYVACLAAYNTNRLNL